MPSAVAWALRVTAGGGEGLRGQACFKNRDCHQISRWGKREEEGAEEGRYPLVLEVRWRVAEGFRAESAPGMGEGEGHDNKTETGLRA